MKAIRKLVSVFITLLVVLAVSVPVFAASLPPMLFNTDSYAYNISSENGTWSGKSEGSVWTLGEGESYTWAVSILTEETRKVSATLNYVRVLFPDKAIGDALSVEGKNNVWQTRDFVTEAAADHYAVITNLSDYSVKGRTSIQ